MPENLLFSHGGGVTIKADGSIEGYLARFGSPGEADTDGEYFTAKTDFGFDGRDEIETRVLYHHGQDPSVGLGAIGRGTLKVDEKGVWFRGQLEKRKRYASKHLPEIKALAAMKDEHGAPILGMSSGSLPHLVTYGPRVKGTREILSWPLGSDASLTPTPADARTFCYALKSEKPAPTLAALCDRFAVKSTKDDDDLDLTDDDAGGTDDGAPAHAGLLVALYPPADVAAALALAGGEPAADLHVTLAYSGDTAALGPLAVAQAIVSVAECARQLPVLAGQINGVGRFAASAQSDGRDVCFATVDVPGLAGARERVARYLQYAGCPARADHGFVPHLTLAYLDPAAESPVARIEPRSVSFGAISVVYGTERIDIPLGAPAAALDYAKAVKSDAIKGAFAEALAEADARQRLWDLWSAFTDIVRDLDERADDGETDVTAALDEAIGEFTSSLRQTAAEIVGATDGETKSSSGTGSHAGRSLDMQGTTALAAVKGLTERWLALGDSILAERAIKVGAAMSGSRRQRARAIVASLREHADSLDRMVAECEPKQKTEPAEDAAAVKTAALPLTVELELLRLRNRNARARSRAVA